MPVTGGLPRLDLLTACSVEATCMFPCKYRRSGCRLGLAMQDVFECKLETAVELDKSHIYVVHTNISHR
jgi:hypothetical protein